uniref:Cysteine protease n=1 Tax=Hucho hucho TaxID=62062 RepID=A0A4W5R8K6_9TELE
MDHTTLTYDTLRYGDFDDFPETSEPVWILGKDFNALTEKDDILSDVTSRLWFTYRKNFPPIGGTGPTSDTGWGCMLRCGQMILGEALVCRHLGRDCTVNQINPCQEISPLSVYSHLKTNCVEYYPSCPRETVLNIIRLALGKLTVLNIIRLALRKLTVFDSWSRLAVHVAMDNTVVTEEIKRLCMPWLDYGGAACAEPPGWMPKHNGCLEGACALAEEETALWKPLVLLIPLRLGLSDINKAYIETLKQCFQLPQSLGVIGGKPNSAHYFIGYVGEELIYLDPHTTQPAVEPCEDSQVPDDTYHCQHPPCRMHICEIDPSIAVGFFCRTEDDFDDWCVRIRKLSHTRGGLPMFELVDCQPSNFACSVDVLNLTPDFSDRLERFFDSEDEEFEILSL